MMAMDPANAVVQLCAAGMTAEAGGREDQARSLFEQAWDAAADAYERCIAAHYVARHQDGPEQALHWNAECLRYADLVADDRVAGFYPSLYLNMGFAHERLGDAQKAGECYRAAEAHFSALPEGPYGEMVRDAVARGLERLQR